MTFPLTATRGNDWGKIYFITNTGGLTNSLLQLSAGKISPAPEMWLRKKYGHFTYVLYASFYQPGPTEWDFTLTHCPKGRVQKTALAKWSEGVLDVNLCCFVKLLLSLIHI